MISCAKAEGIFKSHSALGATVVARPVLIDAVASTSVSVNGSTPRILSKTTTPNLWIRGGGKPQWMNRGDGSSRPHFTAAF